MPADDTRLNHHSTAAKTYLTPAERGELLKLAPRTVRRRVNDDGWPHWGSGASLRFSPENVAAIEAMEAHHPACTAPPLPPPTLDLGRVLKGLQRLDRAKDRADARGGKSAGPRTP